MGQNGRVPDSTSSLAAAPAPHADLTWGQTWPSLQVFTELALEHRRVIPVVRRLLADSETPVGVYRKLARGGPGTFLLESAEHGGVWSRYSIVGARCAATLTERDGETHWIGAPPVGVPTTGDPTETLRLTVAELATDRIPGLPPLTGGMVGAITYDAVRRWERVPDAGRDELDLPELAMMLATDLAVFDHSDGSLLLVANAVNHDATDERIEEAWADAVARLDRMTAELAEAAPSTVATIEPIASEPRSSHTPGAVRGHGRAGQGGDPGRRGLPDRRLTAFHRALRGRCPRRLPGAAGQQPQPVHVPPAAAAPRRLGLRRRRLEPRGADQGDRPAGDHPPDRRHRGRAGQDARADAHLAEELLGDPKERAEHLMLVDLSRNDLQRVCRAGTVDTVEFMSVRRYSHIMHLESTVVGELRADRSAYDALVATFPAGTLSRRPQAARHGAHRRATRGSGAGLYGGVVGYLDFAGDLDMAIAIRTALIQDGLAHVQAGGGIVADSVPHLEFEETVQQGGGRLAAVAAAAGLRPVAGGRGRLDSKRYAVLAVLVPAGLALLLTTRPWAVGEARDVLSAGTTEVTGGAAAPGVVGLVAVTVVALLGLMTGGRVIRAVSGVVLVLAAAGAAALTLLVALRPGRRGVSRRRQGARPHDGTRCHRHDDGVGLGRRGRHRRSPRRGHRRRAVEPLMGGPVVALRAGSRPESGPRGQVRSAWDELSEGGDPTLRDSPEQT